MCIWRQCNKDPSAALGMTVLGERIDSQGRCAAFLEDGILVSQPSPLSETGDACEWKMGNLSFRGLGVWMGNSYFPLLHFYEPARV